MRKPIIGIIGRCEKSETGFPLNVIHEDDRIAIIKSGGIPILILPTQGVKYNESVPRDMKRITEDEMNMMERQIKLCDGIVIPGGDTMYEYDRRTFEYIYRNQIPFLAICMGMQIMSTYNREIDLVKNDTTIEHFSKKINNVHGVMIKETSHLYHILLKDHIKVNSRHRLHITQENGFSATARSTDGIIEALEGDSNIFQLGIQWHPELNYQSSLESKKIYEAFIKSCQKRE